MPGGEYFCGFRDTRDEQKNPHKLPIKWSSGLCDAKLFGAHGHAKVESYLKRIKDKGPYYYGAKAVEVRLAEES